MRWHRRRRQHVMGGGAQQQKRPQGRASSSAAATGSGVPWGAHRATPAGGAGWRHVLVRRSAAARAPSGAQQLQRLHDRVGGYVQHRSRSAPAIRRGVGSDAGHAAWAPRGPLTVEPPLAIFSPSQEGSQRGGSDSRGRRRRRDWRRAGGAPACPVAAATAGTRPEADHYGFSLRVARSSIAPHRGLAPHRTAGWRDRSRGGVARGRCATHAQRMVDRDDPPSYG